MNETPILVVGGAGYIGSHTCLDLAEKGFLPVTYDNLSNGHGEFVKWGPLEQGDIRDGDRLDAVMRAHRPAAIIHFAGLIEVKESVLDPLSFFDVNVSGTISLLKAAARNGIDKLVFSSTCATYGVPEFMPMNETHPQSPINPYGRSKLQIEEILLELSRYAGLKACILRYFNASGADKNARIGEWHEPETHAIPLMIEAAMGRQDAFSVYGEDYDTRDGTCLRDYIHVLDLADAHSRSIQYLLDGGETVALNLGTGTGTTVRELLTAIEATSGRKLNVRSASRRPGDAPSLVADNALAGTILGWTPKYAIDEIIETAWNWHKSSNLLRSG